MHPTSGATFTAVVPTNAPTMPRPEGANGEADDLVPEARDRGTARSVGAVLHTREPHIAADVHARRAPRTGWLGAHARERLGDAERSLRPGVHPLHVGLQRREVAEKAHFAAPV